MTADEAMNHIQHIVKVALESDEETKFKLMREIQRIIEKALVRRTKPQSQRRWFMIRE